MTFGFVLHGDRFVQRHTRLGRTIWQESCPSSKIGNGILQADGKATVPRLASNGSPSDDFSSNGGADGPASADAPADAAPSSSG